MDIDFWGILIRGVAAYSFLLVLSRFLGRQIIAQMTFFEYIVGITVGSLAADMTMAGSDSVWDAALALLIWLTLPIGIGLLSLKSHPARKIVEGEPALVVINGKVNKQALRRQRFNMDDLLSKLRVQGAFNLSDVEFAVLETDGSVSVLKKSQKSPVTPADLGLSTSYVGLPTTLIQDGEVIEHRLKEVRLSKEWLLAELRKRGIESPSQVFVAQMDTSGQLYVDLKDE